MSAFRLYKSTGEAFRRLMFFDKVILNYITIFWIIIPVIYLILEILLKVELGFIFLVVFLALWLVLPIVLHMISNRLRKKLEAIGELTVTTSTIRKSAEGSEETYEFRNIKSLKINIFLRKIFFPSNKDSSQIYMVKIEEDKKSDQFVVSSQSVDKPEVNFMEIIKTVEKRLHKKLI